MSSTETKHTPGVWTFLEEGRTEEEGNASRPLTICDADGNDLANVYSSDDATVAIPREQAIANARLIAAAPELLQALIEARAEIWLLLDARGIHPEKARGWPEIVTAEAAIAKATGSQS